ncbi:hypothetical protein [Microbacterium sp.]|uniref:hypothetical protein n=1 Tax=Microbacterium sp. TaxID=51671 RepID=UPI003A94E44A
MTMQAVKERQWAELDAALQHVKHAEFEASHGGDVEALRMQLDDIRGCLGALALLLAEGPYADAYAELLKTVVVPPRRARRTR